MKTKATAKVIWGNRGGEYRTLCLQVTYQRKTQVFTLGGTLQIRKEDYLKANKAYNEAYAEVRQKCNKGIDIVEQLGEDFSWESFRAYWRDEAWGKRKETGKYANPLITELYEEFFASRPLLAHSTKDQYSILLVWIERYHVNTRIKDITPEFLRKLTDYIKEQSLKGKGKETSETTICDYLRGLRAVLNFAITKGYITQKDYPFGKDKYKLSQADSTNIAMSDEDFRLFTQAVPIGYKEKLGYHFFLLSYMLDGLNLADIIRIKNRDIRDGFLYVNRWKTKHNYSTVNYQKKKLSQEALTIFSKYGDLNPQEPNRFVLRFLRDIPDSDIEMQDRTKKNLNKNINKGLKSLCERIGIKPITLYSARHTYATHVANEQLPISMIQQCLMHKNVTTTQRYIDSISTANQEKNVRLKQKHLEGLHLDI